MEKFSLVAIIYNPNSTGNSKSQAQEFMKLTQAKSQVPVKLFPTKKAGHGEELAFNIATKHPRALIVSASGDGGYSEVINGVMRSKKAVVCAVLPAGNANDHARTVQENTLFESILKPKITKIDLLKISAGTRVRYAHSYIGVGLTPVVAAELNRHNLNAMRELWIVLKSFYKYRPFEIKHKNNIHKLDSLIFANIQNMAKLLTVAKNIEPDDGKFGVISFPARHKILLLIKLSRAALFGIKSNTHSNNYKFETTKKIPIQIDGEVENLAAQTKVEITIAPKALRTLA